MRGPAGSQARFPCSEPQNGTSSVLETPVSLDKGAEPLGGESFAYCVCFEAVEAAIWSFLAAIWSFLASIIDAAFDLE